MWAVAPFLYYNISERENQLDFKGKSDSYDMLEAKERFYEESSEERE